jgi:hypothetical protein
VEERTPVLRVWEKVPRTKRGLGPPVKELGDRIITTAAFVHRSRDFRGRRGGLRPVTP